MLIVVGAATSSGSLAAQKKADTIISLGESNDDAQRQELLGYFGAGDKAPRSSHHREPTPNGAMQDVIPGFNLSSAYSSAALTCRPLGDGLNVTTINITQITPAMFAMALVTAGVGDATLDRRGSGRRPRAGHDRVDRHIPGLGQGQMRERPDDAEAAATRPPRAGHHGRNLDSDRRGPDRLRWRVRDRHASESS